MKGVEAALDEAPFLERGDPARDRRFGRYLGQVGKHDLPIAKLRSEQLEQDVPGGIREQPFAEYVGAPAPDVQNRIDLVFRDPWRHLYLH